MLHLFLRGNGEAKPPPAHTVTGAKRISKKTKTKTKKKQKITKTETKLTTNQ